MLISEIMTPLESALSPVFFFRITNAHKTGSDESNLESRFLKIISFWNESFSCLALLGRNNFLFLQFLSWSSFWSFRWFCYWSWRVFACFWSNCWESKIFFFSFLREYFSVNCPVWSSHSSVRNCFVSKDHGRSLVFSLISDRFNHMKIDCFVVLILNKSRHFAITGFWV